MTDDIRSPEAQLLDFLEHTADVSLRPVVWVGAGASAAAGYPTLAGLEEILRGKLPDSDADGFALVDAFVERYSEADLAAVLQKHLGEPRPSTGIHAALARLADAGVCPSLFTTNYDRLIENALDKAGVAYVVQVLEGNYVLQAVDEVQVLKLHGDRADWLAAVLTSASYTAFEEAHPLLARQLDQSLRTRPVLFVGCSLLDPRLLDWLAALSEKERGRLFASRALLTRDDWAAVPADTRTLLESARIRPILVDGYSAVPRVLLEAAKRLAPLAAEELVFELDPGDETWTVVGPTAESARHAVDNPLRDAELVAMLAELRELASHPIFLDAPEAPTAEAVLHRLAERIGERLTPVLLSAEARASVVRRLHAVDRGRARLTLRVGGESALADRALALPWELLTPEDGSFAVAAGKLDVVREAVVDGGPVLAAPTGPVRVAVSISAPEDQTALKFEDEEYRLYTALSRLGHQVAFADLGGLDDLVEVVEGQAANVVHFSGHGLPGQLAFEDDEGFAKEEDVKELVRRLNTRLLAPGRAGTFPSLFFLASCYGASGTAPRTAEEPEVAAREARRELPTVLGEGPSTAATLHRGGFVQVIGYFGPVGDELCTRAETTFYEAVARGETTLQAVAEARQTLGEPFVTRGTKIRYPLAWAQLALYHRGPDLPLATAGEITRTELGPRFRRRTVEVSGLPVLEFGFIGRRKLQHEVRRKARTGQRLIVVQGLGGLGKTALMSHLLGRVLTRDDADRLILRCANLDEMAGDPIDAVRDQAEEHGRLHALPGWDERMKALRERLPEPAPGFAAVIGELRRERPGLVLYADNVESLQVGPKTAEDGDTGHWKPEAVEWWRVMERLADGGVVLLSTRYLWKELDPDAWIGIGPMSGADVLRMVESCDQLAKLPPDVAQQIAERVDGHPRTVEVLDGLIGERRRQLGPGHQVQDAWAEIVEPVLPKQAKRITADLLLEELWTRLTPEGRSHAARVGVLRRPAPAVVVDRLGERREELIRTSFLTRHRLPVFREGRLAWNDRWGLHSLVRDFVVERLEDETRREAQLAVGLAYKAWVEQPGAIWPDLEEGVQHLHDVGEGDEAWPMVEKYVFWLRRRARYREALALLEGCEAGGASGDRLAAVLMLLVQMRRRLGERSEDQRRTLERALEIVPRGKTRGAVLHELGSLVKDEGKYGEAEILLREGLEISEKTLGKEHAQYGNSLHELAAVVSSQGKYGEAEDLLRESLEISEKALGKEHPDYGVSLQVLASVLAWQGKYGEAEELFRTSLEISEKALGEEHPQLCTILEGLGSTLAWLGKPEQSEPLLRRALAIAEKVFGPQGPDVAQILLTLARVQAATGNPEASATAERAVETLFAALGPEHPVTRKAMPVLQQIIAAGQAAAELKALPPEEREARIAEMRARSVADQVRDLSVGALEADADLGPLIEKLEEVIPQAEENDGPLVASGLRAVIAVLRGEEPSDVPEAFAEAVASIVGARDECEGSQ